MRRLLALALVPVGLFAVAKMVPSTVSSGYSLAASAPAFSPPPEDGPVMRVTAKTVAVRESPASDSAVWGVLRAGSRVIRSADPISRQDCPNGWYAIRPAGVVCASDGVALDDASNPSFAPRFTPNVEGALPYSYVKTTAKTSVVSLDSTAKKIDELPVGTWLAVSGQNQLTDPSGKLLKVLITSNGGGVSAYDVEPVKESQMRGSLIDDPKSMPVGYAVRDGVTPYRLVENKGPEKMMPMGRLTKLALTGKSHNRGQERFLALADGNYVRARDVTLIQRRESFPEFVTDTTRWVDISTVTGTLVAYEGKKPVFATLVSLGTEKAKGTHPTQLGQFSIVSKKFTNPDPQPGEFDEGRDVRDVPWVMELSNGQKIHASVWHDRFGLEFGPGNIQLAPGDAAFLFKWIGGQIPYGWHGITFLDKPHRVQVLVRK